MPDTTERIPSMLEIFILSIIIPASKYFLLLYEKLQRNDKKELSFCSQTTTAHVTLQRR